MTRLASIIIALCALLSVNAQESTSAFRFGFLSYETALQSMPDYAKAQQKIEDMKAQYQAETKRVKDEFNHKYEEFLDGEVRYASLRRTFPENAKTLFAEGAKQAKAKYAKYKAEE